MIEEQRYREVHRGEVASVFVERDHDVAGVAIFGLRDNLDALVAKRLINRAKLSIGNLDILEHDLNLVFGYRASLGTAIDELLDIGVEFKCMLLRLFWHRVSLHCPQVSSL